MRALDELRLRGWSVAIHNDYRFRGKKHTFWLLTHPNGWWVKGEGLTDIVALGQCWDQIERRYPHGGPPQPFSVEAEKCYLTLGFNSPEDRKSFWLWVQKTSTPVT